MREAALITLGLRHDARTLAEGLRPVIDGALALVCEELFDEDIAEHRDLRAQLQSYRRAFAEAANGEQIATAADGCFVVLAKALRKARDQGAERRSELVALVTLVKDAVAVLVGDYASFSAGLGQAADRFESLMAVTDVRQLKERLMSEVLQLRQLAIERKKQWQSAAAMLESRVSSLEADLVVAREEAVLDALTGVGNRRRFDTALREYLEQPRRQFVLAVFDLDDFKRINDTGGHQVGDRVLQAVAQTLRRSVRSDDLVARIGGDEFALLASGTTLPQIEKRLRSIVSTLAQVTTGLDEPSQLTTSCGAAEYCAGDTVHSLVARADEALYDAKRQGKNRVVVKSPPFIRDLLRG